MIDLVTTTKTSLRVDELLAFLPVSRRTVYNWIEEGKIATIPSMSRQCGQRIPIDEVRRVVTLVNGDLLPHPRAVQARAATPEPPRASCGA